jgi:flavin reductase (DIM6/NTAB) family NADH-FMN oxidoreductase RutF
MTFDFETLPQPQRYKLLVGLVVPRPIALVTSIGPGGIVNAAPFSFFNVFSEEPRSSSSGCNRALTAPSRIRPPISARPAPLW